MQYARFNGEMPKGDVDVAMVLKACHMRSGPGTNYEPVGSTKRYAGTRSVFFVTDRRGKWLLLRSGKMNAWVHETCTWNPSPSAGVFLGSPSRRKRD